MPAITPVQPSVFRAILELYGYSVVADDGYNWVLAREITDPSDTPVVLPKLGEFIAVEIMTQILIDVGMDLGTYAALKNRVLGIVFDMPGSLFS